MFWPGHFWPILAACCFFWMPSFPWLHSTASGCSLGAFGNFESLLATSMPLLDIFGHCCYFSDCFSSFLVWPVSDIFWPFFWPTFCQFLAFLANSVTFDHFWKTFGCFWLLLVVFGGLCDIFLFAGICGAISWSIFLFPLDAAISDTPSQCNFFATSDNSG